MTTQPDLSDIYWDEDCQEYVRDEKYNFKKISKENKTMKVNLYSIKDTKLGKYCQPFTAPNNEIAKRMVTSTIRAGGNNIADYPEDMQLYKLGHYDEDTGILENDNEFLANCTEFTKKE